RLGAARLREEWKQHVRRKAPGATQKVEEGLRFCEVICSDVLRLLGTPQQRAVQWLGHLNRRVRGRFVRRPFSPSKKAQERKGSHRNGHSTRQRNGEEHRSNRHARHGRSTQEHTGAEG